MRLLEGELRFLSVVVGEAVVQTLPAGTREAAQGVAVAAELQAAAVAVITGKHGGEAVVEGGVAVFDVAEFVGENGLQFVAAEVVEYALADGKGKVAVCVAEGKGVDAVVVAQDVGVGFVDVGSEAEFGDKVGVAAFCRVVIGRAGVAPRDAACSSTIMASRAHRMVR